MSAARFRAPKAARPITVVKGGYLLPCSGFHCNNRRALGFPTGNCPTCHGTGIELSVPRHSRRGLQMRRRSVRVAVRQEFRRKRGADRG